MDDVQCNKMLEAVSNLRKDKPLGSQAQKDIYNVYQFMNEENGTDDVLNRVAQAINCYEDQ